jgi:MmyB-like transcription regulator ligand binding domain/Helix-turn-helix domain
MCSTPSRASEASAVAAHVLGSAVDAWTVLVADDSELRGRPARGDLTDHYAFLEQGRDVRPSRQVLDALAQALRLGPAERSHLHKLVHGGPPHALSRSEEALSPAVAALVDRLEPCPTYVTGRRWDVLAANRAACALWTDWHALAPEARNMLWWTLTDPGPGPCSSTGRARRQRSWPASALPPPGIPTGPASPS